EALHQSKASQWLVATHCTISSAQSKVHTHGNICITKCKTHSTHRLARPILIQCIHLRVRRAPTRPLRMQMHHRRALAHACFGNLGRHCQQLLRLRGRGARRLGYRRRNRVAQELERVASLLLLRRRRRWSLLCQTVAPPQLAWVRLLPRH
ncbi:hypothetical protein HDK64DRAFT_318146, partial [Phyllosticta capitalensis]